MNIKNILYKLGENKWLFAVLAAALLIFTVLAITNYKKPAAEKWHPGAVMGEKNTETDSGGSGPGGGE